MIDYFKNIRNRERLKKEKEKKREAERSHGSPANDTIYTQLGGGAKIIFKRDNLTYLETQYSFVVLDSNGKITPLADDKRLAYLEAHDERLAICELQEDIDHDEALLLAKQSGIDALMRAQA